MNSSSGDSQKVMKEFNEFMQESERMMSKSQNAAVSQEETKNKPPRMTPLITSVPFVEIRRTCDATLAKRCQGYHNVAFLPVSSKESTIQEPANGIHPSQLNHYKSTPNYYEVKCQPVNENQPVQPQIIQPEVPKVYNVPHVYHQQSTKFPVNENQPVQPQIIQEEPKVYSDCLKKDSGDKLTSCQEKICCCQRVERTCCCSRRNLCCSMASDVFRCCCMSERCCSHQENICCNKKRVSNCDCSKPFKSRPCSSCKHDAVVQTSSDISSNSFSQKEDSLQKEVLFDSTEYILRQLLETLKKNQKALKIGLESTDDIPDDYKCFCDKDDTRSTSEKQKPDKKSKLDEIINRIKQKQSIKKRRPVKKVTVDWGEKNQYEFCHEDEGSNCNCGLSERIKAKNKLCNPLYN